MLKLTIVLLRPDYLADAPYGQDIYVAQVEATTYKEALLLAQETAYDADTQDKLEPHTPNDYVLCVMFEGHHQPKLFGWQI